MVTTAYDKDRRNLERTLLKLSERIVWILEFLWGFHERRQACKTLI